MKGNLKSSLLLSILLFGFFLIHISCQKDTWNENRYENPLESKSNPVSVEEAISYFNEKVNEPSNFNNTNIRFNFNPTPSWDKAFLSQSTSGREYLVVPVRDSLFETGNFGKSKIYAVFIRLPQGAIMGNYLVYLNDNESSGQLINLGNFSGCITFLNLDRSFNFALYMKNGSAVSVSDSAKIVHDLPEFNGSDDRGLECHWEERSYFNPCIAFSACDVWITVLVLVCSGDNDGGSGIDFSGTTNGWSNDNSSGGGSGCLFCGTGGNNGVPNFDNFTGSWVDAILANIPLGIFITNNQENNGSTGLPPGLENYQTAQNLWELQQEFQFTGAELEQIVKLPAVIDQLHKFWKENQLNEASIRDLFIPFLRNQNFSGRALAFVGGFCENVDLYDLYFLASDEDIEFLFDNVGIRNNYIQWLSENPNATEYDKKFALRFVFESPDHPIENLPERLNCFTVNTSGNNNATLQSVAIYVDQPIKNDSRVIDDRSGPFTKIGVGGGHTWLCITQVVDGVEKTLNVGLYPSSTLAAPFSTPVTGAFNDDELHAFDVFVRWENLSDATFNQLINNLKSYADAPDYDLNDFNCTTWAVKELEKIGIAVPQTQVGFPFSTASGLCPGQLGQDLRNNQPPNSYMNVVGGAALPSSCQ